MVVAWVAACDSGQSMPMSIELTAVKRQPGFDPGADDLVVSRNAKGRFAGEQVAGGELGEVAAVISAEYAGRFRGRRASGTLAADVTIVDAATGDAGRRVRARAPAAGRPRARPAVCTGASPRRTSRSCCASTRARRNVSDVYLRVVVGGLRAAERRARLAAVQQTSAFAAGRSVTRSRPTWTATEVLYELGGRIGRRVASGKLRARMTERDDSGATVMTCDSGSISWTAASG